MALTSTEVEQGIKDILSGGQSVRIGNQSYTRANLIELIKLRDKIKDEESAISSSDDDPPDIGIYLANFDHG
jgi:hypothetical protein